VISLHKASKSNRTISTIRTLLAGLGVLILDSDRFKIRLVEPYDIKIPPSPLRLAGAHGEGGAGAESDG
jgi:hypothetical protein